MKFQDVKKCQEYIEKQSEKARLIVVVSGRLGEAIVPSIHTIRQVISIYVYCMDKNLHEQWARNFEKVKAVIVELNELISRIETDHRMQKIVEEPFSINIFTTSTNAGTSAMGTSTIGVNDKYARDCESLKTLPFFTKILNSGRTTRIMFGVRFRSHKMILVNRIDDRHAL
ncbi:unnamed protein product [Rotaria sordida]|uniref:Uncharacterized protein n=1 Tax=Rotaria sordida TaxID=392033 RepID=A0A819V5A8_9BILA|nr:unnamed protein product [Rotaria sordida]